MNLDGLFSLSSKKNKNACLMLAQKLQNQKFFKDERFKDEGVSFEEGDRVTKCIASSRSFGVLKVRYFLKHWEEESSKIIFSWKDDESLKVLFWKGKTFLWSLRAFKRSFFYFRWRVAHRRNAVIRERKKIQFQILQYKVH